MTTIQNELRGIHNRITSLEQSVETLDKDFGELDYFARHNIYSLSEQLVRYRKLDALFTTEEEKAANHTMVLCDLTDCHYCDEKRKKTATLS